MVENVRIDNTEKAESFTAEIASSPDHPARGPLSNRNFRLLWIGEGISLLGDQFYLIALPWLVFQLTGSTLAFGTLLMLEGIPRAAFMLFGGVLTDRLSSRTVMLASNVGRLVLTLVLAFLILAQLLQSWMLYPIAFLFGLADSFFVPAFTAMPPTIVADDALQASNSIIQGTQLATQAIGPAVAGVLVKAIGIAAGVIIDATSFICSIAALLAMRLPPQRQVISVPTSTSRLHQQSIFTELRAGFEYVWHDPVLKPLIWVAVALNFLFAGPMAVGPAALAKERFGEGAAAFGVMMSAIGIGAFIGMILAGSIRPKRVGLLVFGFVAISGICLGLLGSAAGLPTAVILCTFIGLADGVVHISLMTWTQKRIAKEMMGRTMSLFGLASFGLVPISSAVAGLLAQTNLSLLFTGAGIALVATCLLAMLNPELRRVGN